MCCQECLNPTRATYANPVNSYSSDYVDGPQLYDYILHKTTGWNAIVTNIFDVSWALFLAVWIEFRLVYYVTLFVMYFCAFI